ncbi:MAG: GntR family transcriptional regulator, partial [Acidobacteria bacterium]|nr:GntR family transcriptional regulator [Acidobacteriota bacterium]
MALQTRSLREQVYEFLREQMASGGLQPGAFLDLNDLAAQLGISRTPLREALL